MKINTNNEDKITEAIEESQGMAVARYMDYNDVEKAVKGAEESLENEDIPKKYWKGCRIFLNPGHVPNGYRWKAEGTFIIIERFTSGWFLVKCAREPVQHCSYGKAQYFKLQLSRIAIENRPTSWEL